MEKRLPMANLNFDRSYTPSKRKDHEAAAAKRREQYRRGDETEAGRRARRLLLQQVHERRLQEAKMKKLAKALNGEG